MKKWKLYLTTETEVLKIHIPHPSIISHCLPFLSGNKTKPAKPKGSTLHLTPLPLLTMSKSLEVSF